MLVQVRVVGDEGIEVAALQRWLAMDPDLRGGAVTSYAEDDTTDTMGATLDVVNVVLSNGIGLSGLLVAIAGWRRSRAPITGAGGPDIVVRRGDVEVVLSGATEDDIARAVRALEAADGSGSPA
ncbi:effector-associated constant component EACC1 [Embleya sp. MST-111070]|uniref:effector-associated constant component EACC1 n=1 Tax=Embleya sp. MST-111070 TaxID=3398231 RepID=UPI003F732D0E